MTAQRSGAALTRADRLEAFVAARELDVLLVTNLVNVRYLTGFTGTNAACLVGAGVRTFLTDFRYVTQAESQVRGFDRAAGAPDLLAAVGERLAGRVGFEDDQLTVRQHKRLAELAGDDVTLVGAGGLVEQLRAVKDDGEVEAIRAAAELTDELLAYVVERGLVGRTERDVAIDIEREMRVRGGDPAFPTIVASGAHGALPHAAPREVEISRGELITIDLGSTLDGYCSDCTRTFATGEPSDEATGIYGLVLAAQQRGVGAVRAGIDGKEVDALARALIAESGHSEHFGHGIGHGVGIEVHEGPRLSQRSDDTLVTGNVVTVEPGIYLPGQLGVRIEDLVVVTDEGCDVLSHFTKELTTVD